MRRQPLYINLNDKVGEAKPAHCPECWDGKVTTELKGQIAALEAELKLLRPVAKEAATRYIPEELRKNSVDPLARRLALLHSKFPPTKRQATKRRSS